MSTKRRVIDRGKGGRLTPDIIAAWHACDFSALHHLLRLHPWDSSPLPKEIAGGIGVDQDDLLDFDPDTASPADQALPKVVAIQAELLAVAGWPTGARAAYEENLVEAVELANWCRQQVEHPNPGEIGTGCDPESRHEKMLQAEAEVEYRKELIAELPRIQKKWAKGMKAAAPL
jgi:hypothetical protein